MPFSLQVCTPELLLAAKHIADDHGTAMTIHHSGGAGEPEPTPTQRLAEIGVLGPNVVLSHGMNLADADIDLLAESGTAMVICPSTVLKNGANTREGGRLPEFLDAGVPVSLATDSANSSNFLDMVRCMSLAATVYKDARGDSTLIPPETALELATRTGATALQFGEALGAIEVGRKADLVLFDTRQAQWRSLTEPVRNLVYAVSGDTVDTVIVDGRVVVEGGRATFIEDEWGLIQEVEEVGERIRATTGISFPSLWPVV
jgi:cytosine/adenosine deaminase-related metal-dependent hydrolase